MTTVLTNMETNFGKNQSYIGLHGTSGTISYRRRILRDGKHHHPVGADLWLRLLLSSLCCCLLVLDEFVKDLCLLIGT